jgi:hypothetical protein
MKAGDLTTTVGKYLATAYQSTDDLIEIFGWLSLTENLHIAGVGPTDCNQPLIDRGGDKAWFESRELTGRRLGGDDRTQHGSFPCISWPCQFLRGLLLGSTKGPFRIDGSFDMVERTPDML